MGQVTHVIHCQLCYSATANTLQGGPKKRCHFLIAYMLHLYTTQIYPHGFCYLKSVKLISFFVYLFIFLSVFASVTSL